jgi:hypothetical protein
MNLKALRGNDRIMPVASQARCLRRLVERAAERNRRAPQLRQAPTSRLDIVSANPRTRVS